MYFPIQEVRACLGAVMFQKLARQQDLAMCCVSLPTFVFLFSYVDPFLILLWAWLLTYNVGIRELLIKLSALAGLQLIYRHISHGAHLLEYASFTC